MRAVSVGIAPTLLAEQVRNTAAWIVDDASLPPVRAVRNAAELTPRWQEDAQDPAYLELMLSAHFLTVATFVPTDVDSRIRHHHWATLPAERFEAALDAVDAIAALDARVVSARVVELDEHTRLSGHQGEWLAVRAGALGRALSLGLEPHVARLRAAIDRELEHEARCFVALERDERRALDALRAATTLAHNVGDLSRVVEQWPKSEAHTPIAERYVRLGHGKTDAFEGAFARAGMVNKEVMAHENHRFLALRAATALRRSPDLLLPVGPFFDDWGKTVATSRDLEESDRAETLECLLATHLRGPEQHGCLRAIAALHEHSPGGVDRLARELPARLRKLVTRGPVRDALGISRGVFEARMVKRARAAFAAARA